MSIEETVRRLSKAKVIAIVRAKNFDVAVRRGVELVNLGCKAIEVTTDSVRFPELLSELVRRVGDKCVVGVGTITTLEQLRVSRKHGAKFALSPVNPKWNFVKQCHEMDIVAVPAAFSPQEIYDAFMQGARCIKVFPAQLWTPNKFKSLRGIGEFGIMNLIPSGGISPETAKNWLDAGAFAVGMGSNLVGKDVRVDPNDTETLHNSAIAWNREGRPRATKLFRSLNRSSKHSMLSSHL